MIVDELIALLGFETRGEGELRKFNDGLTDAERKAQAVANRINAMSVAIGTFAGQIAIDFARGIGRTLGSLPGDVLAVGKEFENLGIRFETLEGSADKGREALEWVRQFAVDTPLDLAQAANAYARLPLCRVAGVLMTEAEIRKIVAETVKETLTRIGIEADDPIEVQKDMQHLRAWRESVATVKRQGLITAIGILTAGVIGALWLAVKGPS